MMGKLANYNRWNCYSEFVERFERLESGREMEQFLNDLFEKVRTVKACVRTIFKIKSAQGIDVPLDYYDYMLMLDDSSTEEKIKK